MDDKPLTFKRRICEVGGAGVYLTPRKILYNLPGMISFPSGRTRCLRDITEPTVMYMLPAS